MGFYTKAQIVILRDLADRRDAAAARLLKYVAKFTPKGKHHTGCCRIGVGKMSGSGVPCKCGEKDDPFPTLADAYEECDIDPAAVGSE
jgi:hypothetical protein